MVSRAPVKDSKAPSSSSPTSRAQKQQMVPAPPPSLSATGTGSNSQLGTLAFAGVLLLAVVAAFFIPRLVELINGNKMQRGASSARMASQSIYDFTVKDIKRRDVNIRTSPALRNEFCVPAHPQASLVLALVCTRRGRD